MFSVQRLRRFAVAAVLLSGLIAAQGSATKNRGAEFWLTTMDGSKKLERQADLPFANLAGKGTLVTIDAGQKYQTIEGFGASFTDSASWLIQNRLGARQRAALLQDLFDRKKGIGLSLTRLTIGASDFSLSHYSLNDMPPGQTDPKLQHFALSRTEPAVLDLVAKARRINPDLLVFASPWSAPGWMKTSDSLIKGRLKPEHYQSFARYLTRYIQEMQRRGIPVYGLTIQNEPHFQPENYPGMHMSAEERAAFIADHLGPLFVKRNIRTKIYDWDHNWDEPSSPLALLANPAAAKFVAGTAWHCYAGNVSAQSLVHDAHPHKETWFTECSGGGWSPEFGPTLGWMTENLIIGTTRNWAKGVILWNLALDEKSGPHLGGCGNCRGVVTIDQATGVVTRNVEYYALAHASKFVEKGAVRIASASSNDGLLTVAFRNPDKRNRRGSTILIAYNKLKTKIDFGMTQGKNGYTAQLQPGAVATFQWDTVD